jgi:hypothetical protein
LYSQIPESGLGDFVVSRTTTPTANRSTRVNAQGFIETVADNVPRLDYPLGGIAAGCPALLVEPAATNQIRNNTMVGAVAGTPGTLPTNHSTTLNGLTRTIVGVGSENGVDYIDVQVSGTATGSSFVYLFETGTQIVAAQGQTWTNSMWMKQIADVGGNRPAARVTIYENTSGGVYLGEGSLSVALTSSLTRFSFTRTLVNALTARVIPAFQFFLNVGTTYNFTIRIGLPQMELGSVATSVIPTTTQAITRGVETISKTGVSSLIGQTEGTIYVELDMRNFVSNTMACFVSDGTGLNSISVQIFAPPNSIRVGISRLGVGQIDFIVPMPSGVNKVALGYAQNNVAIYLNGTSVATSAVCLIPATSRVDLGSRIGTGSYLNDRIRSLAIYPTRLTNAQLQALTT